MNIRRLEIFLAVAKSGSITKAAGLLGRSQPTVTRTIQELEVELGFALLERVGRRIVLSNEGVAFEEEAKLVLKSLTGLAERTRSIASGATRPIRLASTAAIGTGILPSALKRFSPARPPKEIEIAQLQPNVVALEVSAGRAEAGYSSMPLDVPGLSVHRLYMAHDVAALPARHRLAKLKTVPLDAFDGCHMATMLDPEKFQGKVARAMEALGVKEGSAVRTNSAYAALQLVRRAGLLAIVDPVTAHGVSLTGVVIRPIDTPLPFYWGAVTPSGRPPRPIVEELIDAVEDTAKALIPDFVRLDPSALNDVRSIDETPRPKEGIYHGGRQHHSRP